MNRRRFFSAAVVPIGILASVMPAVAQELPPAQIPDFGLQLPWFRSRAENLRREACIEGRPECTAETRRKMAMERTVTWTTPFLLVGGLVLVALFYARKAEKEKIARRLKAQREHVPARMRKAELENKKKEEADDNDDAL